MAATLTRTLRKLSFVLWIFVACHVYAAENFTSPAPDLKVYSGPSRSTPVLATLQKGQTVLAGANPAGGLRKVLVVDSTGKKKIGYIFIADLGLRKKISAQSAGDDRSDSANSSYNRRQGVRRYSIGIVPGLNYQSQSSRTITDNTGAIDTAQSLSGVNFQIGLQGTMTLTPKFSLLAFLEYKPTVLNTNTLPANQGLTTTSATFNQNFYVVGAETHFYPKAYGKYWWGIGGELDFGSSSTLTATSPSQTLTVSTNIYTLLYLTTGYDFSLGQRLVFTPSIRLGGILNTSPIIVEGDILAALSYKF